MASFITTAEFGKDSTYNSIHLYQLVIAEGGTYLIASCMPTLRSLRRRFFPEYSFTRFVESTLKIFSINSNSYAFGTNTAKKMGNVRTSGYEVDSSKRPSANSRDLESGSTAELRVVGKK
jgi:hypothetical protein